MAWMSEAAAELFEDSRDKAITARSARNRRGHTGKGGPVRLPSDFLTEKQLEALNGECKTYRLGEPMSFGHFADMPADLRVMYIRKLREKFNVPDMEIARMFGITIDMLLYYYQALGIKPSPVTNADAWNVVGWSEWLDTV